MRNGSAFGEDLLGRIPPSIAEDKHYPRRTLEYGLRDEHCWRSELTVSRPTEIEALQAVQQNSESPDLGPPPVAHFQLEDPIKFDARPDYRDVETEPKRAEEERMAAIPANLETRKKRRDSSVRLDIRRVDVFQSPPNSSTVAEKPPVPQPSTIRTGAKRKLSSREEEAKAPPAPKSKPTQDDFKFSRRLMDVEGQKAKATKPPESPRKVLGDKSVNTEAIASPKKALKGPLPDGKPERKAMSTYKQPDRPVVRGRPRKAEAIQIPLPDAPDKIEATEIREEPAHSDLPPKTPAPESILSPISTELSARHDSRDTPPPADINPAGSDVSQTGRIPRRARVSVNYAEPSLNTKMRRPGKEMVDAVTGLKERPMQIKDGEEIPRGSEPPSTVKSGIRTVVIKRERDGSAEAPSWKQTPSAVDEPGSPLSKKSEEAQAQQAVSESIIQGDTHATCGGGAGATISALMARPTSGKRNVQHIAPEAMIAAEPDTADIFEFTESSEAYNSDSNAPSKRQDIAANVRSSRRHSSVPSIDLKGFDGRDDLAGAAADKVTEHLKQSQSTKQAASDADVVGRRAERTASRRRSMML